MHRWFEGWIREDPEPFVLTDEELAELRELRGTQQELDELVKQFRRKVARERGFTALRLEELGSRSGEPYQMLPEGKRSVFAEAQAGIGEHAYLCMFQPDVYESLLEPNEHIDLERDLCGWVKGFPKAEAYDDIGALSGSAGIQYHCKVCGMYLGHDAYTHS